MILIVITLVYMFITTGLRTEGDECNQCVRQCDPSDRDRLNFTGSGGNAARLLLFEAIKKRETLGDICNDEITRVRYSAGEVSADCFSLCCLLLQFISENLNSAAQNAGSSPKAGSPSLGRSYAASRSSLPVSSLV